MARNIIIRLNQARHKLRKHALDLVLIVLSFVAVNLVHAINLDELESIRFSYSTKPNKTNWKNIDVSFGSRDENVRLIVEKILKPTGKQIEGLEQLDGLHRTVMMKKVKAFKALTTLLKCEGFKITEKNNIFVIDYDRTIDRKSCLF